MTNPNLQNIIYKTNSLLLILALLFVTSCNTNQNPDYKNPDIPVDQRVADLLKRMTLEEKVAQTLSVWWEKSEFMTPEDQATYDSFPDEITIYRGAYFMEQHSHAGQSWTIDIVNARFFAWENYSYLKKQEFLK